MTAEVIPYVSPFVILNKAELATLRVNIKTEFNTQGQIHTILQAQLLCSLIGAHGDGPECLNPWLLCIVNLFVSLTADIIAG